MRKKKKEGRTSETQLIKYVPGQHRQRMCLWLFGSIFIFFEFLVPVRLAGLVWGIDWGGLLSRQTSSKPCVQAHGMGR